MRRMLAMVLCFVLAGVLVACGETGGSGDGASTQTEVVTESETSTVTSGEGVTDSDSDKTSSGTQTETDDGQSESSSETKEEDETKDVQIFNPEIEHKFIANDIINFSLVVFDLNLCEGDFTKLSDESCVVWEWKSREDPNCKYANKIIRSISGVKFRYSEYYKRDVVIACANFGWVGVIDYDNCSLLWECALPVGPHSVEMLPNGDVVVGSADGEGALIYFPLSAGITEPVHSIVSPSCHGVCWDPVKECLWVLEGPGIHACTVENPGTAEGKLVRVEGSGDTFSGDNGGHAFAPIGGEPGKYWASAGKALWRFDTDTQKITGVTGALSSSAIKGICSFSDRTVIESVAGLCGKNKYSWGSDGFRIITRELSTGKVKVPRDVVTVVPFRGREFYKIQAFDKNYQ